MNDKRPEVPENIGVPNERAMVSLEELRCLTVPEVADLLGLSASAVRLKIARKELPAVRLGNGRRVWRIPLLPLKELIQRELAQRTAEDVSVRKVLEGGLRPRGPARPRP